MRTPLRLATVWAVLLAVLTLGACAGLPTDSEPRAGQPVLGQPRPGPQARPESPRPDASQEEIVRGFLLANVGFVDSHDVARDYLTDALAASWVPTDNVVIHDGDYELTSTGDGTIEVSGDVRGVLGDEGLLTEMPTGTRRTEEFALSLVSGQWRIEEFPEDFGLWLSSTDFELQFRTASIAYLSPVSDVFVPDTRWFPRDEGLPTALARAVLEPVPDYLDGAVATAVTEDMELVAGAVPVDAATATAVVNLRGPGLTDDAERTRRLWAQLTQTLTQAGGVQRVDLQINGRSVTVPEVEGPVASAAELGFTEVEAAVDYALLRVQDRLTLVDPTDYALRTVPASTPDLPRVPAVPEQWQSLSTDQAVEELAALSADRATLWRWRDGEELERPEIGADLTDPVFDRMGSLWLAGRSATGPRVWAVDTGGGLDTVARRIDADWLGGDVVVDKLRVSPEGQRVVLELSDPAGGQHQLVMSGIVRDREGRPTGLTEPRPVADVVDSISSVAWASTTTLVVLGQRADDDIPTPYQLPLGSWLEALRAEPGADQMRAAPTLGGFEMFLVTESSDIFTLEGAGWYSYRNGDDLVIPAG